MSTPQGNRRTRGAYESGQDSDPGGISRRALLVGGAVAGVGAAAAIGADGYLNRDGPSTSAVSEEPGEVLNGEQVVPFHGAHQAGVAVPPQAHAMHIALDLAEEVDREGMGRLMRILSDDASRLTQGQPALADTGPEMARVPARLTVTFGFGPEFVRRAGGPLPEWLAPLPAFGVDRLDPAWCEGDLLVEVASDDAVTVAHATRMLLKGAASFATVRWSQPGFRRAYGSQVSGTTMRNLFGQVDGTVNLQAGTADFDRLVWCAPQAGWLAGGSSLVIRRNALDMDGWDRLDRPGREESVGRTLDTGAPLTGTQERDEPDFEALSPIGFPVIGEFSHIRRARSDNPDERFYRRAYNYEDPPGQGGAGLLFTSFQADPLAQFVPIQQRLDDLDLLNEWTTPVGSALFAIPPGCAPGGFIGETLLA